MPPKSKTSKCAAMTHEECGRSADCQQVHMKDGTTRCRARPSKRNSSKARGDAVASARSSARASARGKLARWARSVSPPCNTMNLVQRGGTCYMASATLAFGRTMMKRATDSRVREYVLLSMGNAHDRAQGKAADPACPNIPPKVRRYYAALQQKPKRDDLVIIRGNDLKKTDAHPNMLSGGATHSFLAALMWSANIPCTLMKYQFKAQRDGTSYKKMVAACENNVKMVHTYFEMYGERKREACIVAADVVDLNDLYEKKGIDARIVLKGLVAAYEEARRSSLVLRAVLLTVANQRYQSHAMAAFPCVKGAGDHTSVNFVLCNTHGKTSTVPNACTDFVKGLEDFYTRFQGKYLLGLAFLIN